MKMKKFILPAAAALVAVGGFSTPVSAADSNTKDTTVSYNNQNSIDGESGVWGVVVPTAVIFTDGAGETQKFNLELVGINGFELADLNDDLKVQVSAESKNSYKLVNDAGDADYSVSYPETNTQLAVTTSPANPTKAQVAELSKDVNVSAAEAELTRKPTVNGTFTDTITYSIAHTGDELQ